DERLTSRWPFPGPGLAIRCLCSEKEADVIPVELPDQFRDYEAIHFPIKSVGVQGDARTYREVVAVRGGLDDDRLANLATSLCNTSRVYNRAIVLISGPDHLHAGKVKPQTLNKHRIELLREADYVVRSAMETMGLTEAVWQFPTVLIPVSFDGK